MFVGAKIGLARLLCTRDDYGKAGPFSVGRLKMDLPFVNVSCAQTRLSIQRSTRLGATPHRRLRVL